MNKPSILVILFTTTIAFFAEVKASEKTSVEPLQFREGQKEIVIKKGYKIFSSKVIKAKESKIFKLPKGAKVIGYYLDRDFAKLRESNLAAVALPILLKTSEGASSKAVIGGRLTKGENKVFDDVDFTLTNLSSLDRRVLIYWK